MFLVPFLLVLLPLSGLHSVVLSPQSLYSSDSRQCLLHPPPWHSAQGPQGVCVCLSLCCIAVHPLYKSCLYFIVLFFNFCLWFDTSFVCACCLFVCLPLPVLPVFWFCFCSSCCTILEVWNIFTIPVGSRTVILWARVTEWVRKPEKGWRSRGQ